MREGSEVSFPPDKTLFPLGAGTSASKFWVLSFKSLVAELEDGVVWWYFLGLPQGIPLKRCCGTVSQGCASRVWAESAQAFHPQAAV